MATLIAVYNSEGCVGHCDARCYDAAEPGCECICGGRNHGAGFSRALDNTRAVAERWVEQAGVDVDRAQLHHLTAIEPLF